MEPYKEKKRERRIRDRERMIQHGKQVFYMMWGSYSFSPRSFQRYQHFVHEAEMYGRKYYNNLKACSCSICCNPRRNGWNKEKQRLTIQELKALEAEKDNESSKD
ncbi:hypothetical protein LCGC14_1886440 [marine sediment metagenome]|uniref:Uncharacterized protein n=1 Tax=marine sediment metagenome TaxID=412755 RepID=A0A0F9IZ43_9ZZZZ